jgi:hypothetical protein
LLWEKNSAVICFSSQVFSLELEALHLEFDDGIEFKGLVNFEFFFLFSSDCFGRSGVAGWWRIGFKGARECCTSGDTAEQISSVHPSHSSLFLSC